MCRAGLLVSFVVCASVYAAPPAEVPFSELVKHPRKYNGKRVSVRAYVVTSCTHCGEFWESVKAARNSQVHNSPVLQCVAIGGYRRGYLLPKWFARRLDSQDYDGYVHVVGRFEYIQDTRINRRFGWYGLFDKQITDIAELIPLGAPIPAHIN
jgi:hypothetical protein